MSATITCPRCQTENSSDARFCKHCGRSLGPTDPTGAPGFPAGSAMARPREQLAQYIPAQLLAKLEAVQRGGGGRVAAERRIVTILFCDVQGSTALAEQLDPEEWAELINGAFPHLIAPIYRYEGTLARLMGDAILAFFGAPIAHEDDPERAVRAGLEIVAGVRAYQDEVRRRWGLTLEVRVGINTGLVVVGEVGSDLRVEYTALGDAVNLSARMEQTAAAGTVQIAEATYRAVAGAIEAEALGDIAVKGKSAPVRAYRVLRLRAGGAPAQPAGGLRSPLVGRQPEITILRERLDEVRRGQGQLVVVLGEAGLGKSRLVAEARRWAEEQGWLCEEPRAADDRPALRWQEGRARSYDTMTPYAPFRALFGDWFGLRAEQTEAGQYGQIRDQVGRVAPEQVAEIAPYLALLLGVTVPEETALARYLEPEQVRERIFAAVAGYLAAAAGRQPLVVVFEDVHWADPTSLALLERLLGLADEVPLLLLLAMRPLRQEAAWRLYETAVRDYPHRTTVVPLEPLAEAESRQLVGNLLAVEGLRAGEWDTIVARTDGNPFYIEEVLRGLVESGALVRDDGQWHATQALEQISIPSTVIGVLTARLDRLDEATRRVAQTAAVIGREFAYPVLARVRADGGDALDLDGALRELQRRELIRELSRFPERTYRFKHALTQEAAYASLLLSRRRELHGRVAEALVATYPERGGELRSLLAYHYGRAERWQEALAQAELAGDAAALAYANQEALDFYQQALQAAERAGADAGVLIRLHRAQGGAHDTLGAFEAARADYETVLELARDAGDQAAAWQGLLDLGLLWASRDYGQTGTYYQQALARTRGMDNPAALAHSLNRVGNWYANIEQPAEALRHHHEALAIFQTSGDTRGLAETFDLLGMASFLGGDLPHCVPYFEQAIAMFRALDNRRGLASSLATLALCAPTYQLSIHAPVALAPAEFVRAGEEAIEIAREIGWRSGEAYALGALAQSLGARGDYGRALDLARSSIAAAEEIEHRQWVAHAHWVFGMLMLDLLALPPARAHLEHALALAQAAGSLHWIRNVSAFLAAVRLLEGDLAGAGAVLDQALGNDEPALTLGQRLVWCARADLALARGEADRALLIVDQLRTRTSGASAEPSAEAEQRGSARLLSIRGAALLALGRTADAETALRAAQTVARAQGTRPLLWRIQVALGTLLTHLGRAEAASEVAAAQATIAELAAELGDDPLREAFLTRATAMLPR